MRSGLDRNLQEAAVKAAQDRVDFIDAGGRPDNFQTFFSEKIDAVGEQVKNARLGVNASEDAYRAANTLASDRILKSGIMGKDEDFDAKSWQEATGLNLDQFNKNVVLSFNDKIDNELYAIRDLTSNRGSMDYSDPEYVKMRSNLTEKFPNLASLSPKQLVERRVELKDTKKQYMANLNAKYIDLTQKYRKAQDAEAVKKDLTDFETAVTTDLPGVLYKTEIQENKLGSFLDFDNSGVDSQILTQATNALGVDAMNRKLFGIGPEADKLQYNPKTKQYSLPLERRYFGEERLAPRTVAEAELYYKGGITHGQHKTGHKYRKNAIGGIDPVRNKIFYSDAVTPVPVARYNRGGKVGMGLGSR